MIAILSDIHGSLYALESVMNDISKFPVENIILLGDLIDYGQQSNEIIAYLKNELSIPIICNLWGNHERSIMQDDYQKFSSDRGKNSARYTKSILTDESKEYIEHDCIHSCCLEFAMFNKKCLAVHGSLEDHAWIGIDPENLHGNYQDYDIVFSGHTHKPHCFTKFYDSNDASFRYKKTVLFINPGSVGQPRNHNANAQYAIIDPENWSVFLRSVRYDVSSAMSLFHGQIDDFYRSRLLKGI